MNSKNFRIGNLVEEMERIEDDSLYYNCSCSSCGMDELECDCDTDYCCYDYRYRGESGTCHCEELAEEERLLNHWFWGRYYKFKYVQLEWLKQLFSINRVRRYLFHKTQCDECSKETMTRKWKDVTCPNCGCENLPF